MPGACRGGAGLADYWVRNWIAWHHHQALSLLAERSSNREARRGKARAPALTPPQLRRWVAGLIKAHLDVNTPSSLCRHSSLWLRRNELARFYHHRSRKVMPRLKDQPGA